MLRWTPSPALDMSEGTGFPRLANALQPVLRELDRSALNMHCVRYIIRFSGEGSIRVPNLFVFRAHFANGIVRAIVPGDTCFTIHHRPLPMTYIPNRFRSVTTSVQRDGEILSVAFAQFPLAQEVAPAKGQGTWDVLARLGGTRGGTLELNTGNIRHGKTLLTPIFEDNYDRLAVLRLGGGFRRCAMSCHTKCYQNPKHCDSLMH